MALSPCHRGSEIAKYLRNSFISERRTWKLPLALDLDETLVYQFRFPSELSIYKENPIYRDLMDSYTTNGRDRNDLVAIPGVDGFLKARSEYYDLYVVTCAQEVHAKAAMKLLARVCGVPDETLFKGYCIGVPGGKNQKSFKLIGVPQALGVALDNHEDGWVEERQCIMMAPPFKLGCWKEYVGRWCASDENSPTADLGDYCLWCKQQQTHEETEWKDVVLNTQQQELLKIHQHFTSQLEKATWNRDYYILRQDDLREPVVFPSKRFRHMGDFVRDHHVEAMCRARSPSPPPRGLGYNSDSPVVSPLHSSPGADGEPW